MHYFRLRNETNVEIRISIKGLEIPNAECVQVDIPLPIIRRKFGIRFEGLPVFSDKIYFITFEDGRVVRTTLTIGFPTEYIFTKLKNRMVL